MYTIVVYTPVSNADAVRAALAEAGGGAAGAYDFCSFTSVGEGRFRPLEGAHPTIGRIGELTTVPEARIEAVVPAEALQRVVRAVRAAHSYEEPAIHVSQVMDYKTLLGGAAADKPAVAVDVDGGRPPPLSIVLEGLDGVGKSTAVAALAARLGAQVLRTPPDSMRPFRAYFDRADAPLRNAYYEVGNFIAGEAAAALLKAGQPVIFDRFHAATFSYRYGRSAAPLPPDGDDAYAWPRELHRPSRMILLTLPHADRVARRASRLDVVETAEEAALRRDPAACERINEAYRRFGCTEVALAVGDGVDVVVDKVMAALGLPHNNA